MDTVSSSLLTGAVLFNFIFFKYAEITKCLQLGNWRQRLSASIFMTKKQIGYLGESLAEKYLIQNNYLILAKNYTIKGGEIDIIARDLNTQEIVFVEVKTRTSLKYGFPEQAVNSAKKYHLNKTAQNYLFKNKYSVFQNYRFDIISVKLNFNTKKAKVRQFRYI